MKIERTLFAQSLRFVGFNESTFYAPDVIRSIRDRYGFVRVPETPQDMMPGGEGNPLVFNHGRYVHTYEGGHEVPIVIRFLRLYRQAIAVEVNNDLTDQCDIVADDFLSWFPLVVRSHPERLYTSQIEVRFDIDRPLEAICPLASILTRTLTQKIAGYGAETEHSAFENVAPFFEVSSVVMSRDSTLAFTPCDFRIERRAEAAYSTNLYFSQAPLRTNDHLEVLQLFENTLRGSATA